MQVFVTASHWLARLGQWVSGIALLALMSVTVADVLTRLIFRFTAGSLNLSFNGSVELVSYLMMFSLLAAMAANIEKSQVVVEAFSHRLPETFKRRLAGLFLFGFCVLGVVMAWGLWQEATIAAGRGQVTQDLRIPMGPIYQFGALLCALLAARGLVHAVLAGVFASGEDAANE